jgi:ATP-binding cassette subfamily B protein RaxB
MTIGVLYAFIAYRSQFMSRAISLFEQAVSWRLLDIYTFRIADLVHTPVEAGLDIAPVGLPEMVGRIEIEDVTYRYSASEPAVLDNLTLTIEAGEFVAITGPSGVGKSTLLKVLCGLYPVTAGEIRIDGLPLKLWGPKALRSSMGVVMQDDELLPGSIADNVSFFDENADHPHIWTCLRIAAVDEDVRNLPMRLDTFVGDLGNSFSGGQKQRILLARALYKRPRILVLDEATSHLDLAREKRVNEGLTALNITRVVVAHRPETIGIADRVVSLTARGLKSRLEPPRHRN